MDNRVEDVIEIWHLCINVLICEPDFRLQPSFSPVMNDV